MSLDTPRHVKYWQRCFKSILPHHYTSMDSSRLALGYFILGGLDLLFSTLSASVTTEPLIPKADRKRLRDWILSLQHRYGGFCGSPHHVFPESFEKGFDHAVKPAADDTENANIAATAFALLMLGIIGEDREGVSAFRGVKRVQTLRWLRKLQRPDGSFGEFLKKDGTVGGGKDMRYCYVAAMIRWMLCGNEIPQDGPDKPRQFQDLDVDGLVGHIRRGQTFDGGIAESSMGESHAGYAYCAVAALSLLDRAEPDGDNKYLKKGIRDIPALVHWLVARQFIYTASEDPESESAKDEPELSALNISESEGYVTGFNGRLNKIADTCYTWWVFGALRLLDKAQPGTAKAINRAPSRSFLLEKTQHPVLGGFGKHAERPPDVYHSYMGLAALETMAGEDGEEGVSLFDAGLCISSDAAARIEVARRFWN